MLKGRQLKFAEGVLRGLKAAQAYRKAGYTKGGAASHVGASRLLRNTKVANYIEQHQKEIAAQIQDETLVEVKDVVREAKRIAFFDARKLFDEKGNLKQIVDLDDDTAAAIAGCDVERLFEGRGEDREHIGNIVKLKLANKNDALEKLFKYLGLYRELGSETNPFFIHLRNLSAEERSKRIEALKKKLPR